MNLFISQIPLFFLVAEKGKRPLILSMVIFVTILCIAQIIQRKKNIHLQRNLNYPMITSLIGLMFAIFFYLRWNSSGRIISLANMVQLPSKQTCVLTTILLTLLSLKGIDNFIVIYLSIFPKMSFFEKESNKKTNIFIFITLTTLTFLFLNSRCSPFYPLNDWGDPNTMFTVGKGVLSGHVPYRDLYEQKGPLLIFLHTFSAAISYDTFLGVWFFELIACFAFLYISYKILLLFFDHKSFIIIPVFAAIIYSPYAFRAGDTAEEFALSLLAYALYVGCKAIKAQSLPSRKEFFIVGATSGAVFWMKYSITGFYLGWFLSIIFFTITKKNYRDLIKGCGQIFIGVISITIPVFLYFVLNHSLNALFESYFYNNMVYYSKEYSLLEKMKIGIDSCKLYFSGAIISTALGIVWMILHKQFKLCIYIILTSISTFFFIYFGGSRGPYYCLPLGIFSIFGFFSITQILFAVFHGDQYYSFSAGNLFIGLLILCTFSHNLRFLEYEKPEMFQFQMKDIIEKNGIQNPSILYYQIGDAGVNTVVGSIPDIRFFCYYNNDLMTEIKETQDQCIAEQCVDYIIARTKFDNVYPQFETYEHQKAIVGMADRTLEYFHYYTPKSKN